MPYRTSDDPINERRRELDAMLHASSALKFKVKNSREAFRLRYRIHEALHAARMLDRQPYNQLHFTIRVRGDTVFAVPVEPLVPTIEQLNVPTFECATSFEIVGIMLQQRDVQLVKFTNADIITDLDAVAAWCESSNYSMNLDGGTLTLQKEIE